ncbi:hypothetical protein CsSME_00019194 [Camellia sinensis var. sinensis]
MITRGYKQTSKTGRRLSFSISTSSLQSSGGLGHSDIGLRSVDQSDLFYHHELYHQLNSIISWRRLWEISYSARQLCSFIQHKPSTIANSSFVASIRRQTSTPQVQNAHH